MNTLKPAAYTRSNFISTPFAAYVFLNSNLRKPRLTMGYFETMCQLCGVSFAIAHLRRADEPEEATWDYTGSDFVNADDANYWTPESDDQDFEVEGDYFLTGVGDGSPDEAPLDNIQPARHGISHIIIMNMVC